MVVVLEGAARRGVRRPATHGPVTVRHAPGSGDDLIAGLAAPGDVVVTSDRGLAARVRAAGATVHGAGWLLDRLDAAAGPG